MIVINAFQGHISVVSSSWSTIYLCGNKWYGLQGNKTFQDKQQSTKWMDQMEERRKRREEQWTLKTSEVKNTVHGTRNEETSIALCDC